MLYFAVKLSGFAEAVDRLDLKGQGFRISQAAMRGMMRHVPYDTGKLRQGAYTGYMCVVYSRGVDYAGYVYNGRGHARYPGTSLNWSEAYEATGMREVVEEIERCIGDK